MLLLAIVIVWELAKEVVRVLYIVLREQDVQIMDAISSVQTLVMQNAMVLVMQDVPILQVN